MEDKDEKPSCPECGLYVEQSELDMFGGYCEQCYEEIHGED